MTATMAPTIGRMTTTMTTMTTTRLTAPHNTAGGFEK